MLQKSGLKILSLVEILDESAWGSRLHRIKEGFLRKRLQ